MPARSVAQRKLMGLALHHPDKVSSKNKGVLSMTADEMEDFAKTKEKGLPEHSETGKRIRKAMKGAKKK